MSRQSNPALIKSWLERLSRFHASGQTVAEFCSAENISVPSFYQWKRRLSPDVKAPKGKPTASRTKPSRTKAFSQVTVAPTVSRPALVRLENGVTIELGTELNIVETIVAQVLLGQRNLDVEKPTC